MWPVTPKLILVLRLYVVSKLDFDSDALDVTLGLGYLYYFSEIYVTMDTGTGMLGLMIPKMRCLFIILQEGQTDGKKSSK